MRPASTIEWLTIMRWSKPNLQTQCNRGKKWRTTKKVPPNADTMVASIRAIGYNLPMAIADIIDNSISARAKNIWIDFDWASGDPYIRVKDDGRGMTEDELREAMRLCGKGPDEQSLRIWEDSV